jgi:hypothetical protein
MLENRSGRARVILTKRHQDDWLSTILHALVARRFVPRSFLEIDFHLRIDEDDWAEMELSFSPSAPYEIGFRVIVVEGEAGWITLLVVLPYYGDETLCSTTVPPDGWQSGGDVLASN